MQYHTRSRRGFTRVELLLIGTILTVMGALFGPSLSNAASSRRETILADQLQYLRTQILVYRAQHQGRAPGFPDGDLTAAPTYEAFVAQMTKYTDRQGRTSNVLTDEFAYGPYLHEMPINPLNNSPEIRMIPADTAFPDQADGAQGWMYKPWTCRIGANSSGADLSGEAFASY